MSTESAKQERLLAPWQRRVVAAAIAYMAVLLILGLSFFIFTLFVDFLSHFASVIWPLAIAGIMALILRPIVFLIEEKLKVPRMRAIVYIFSVAMLLIAAFLAFAVPTITIQLIKFGSALPDILTNARDALVERMQNTSLSKNFDNETIREYVETAATGLRDLTIAAAPAIGNASKWVLGLFGSAAAAAIIPVYLFFFLMARRDPMRDIEEHLSFVNGGIREDILFLMREFVLIMVAFFRGQFLVGFFTGILLAIGFTLCGLQFGIVLGMMLGLLNVVPYLGTLLGLGTVLPIAYFQDGGGLVLMALCLVVFIISQMIESYVITPRIMGKETGLHPLAIIIAVFFWGVALQGLLGMVLGIPLTAFIIIAWRLLRQKYLDRWREQLEGEKTVTET